MSKESESKPGVEPEPAPVFRISPLRGRHVFLRPVSPEDYRFIRSADLGGELAVRWRFRGSTGSPEQWAQSLWQAVLAQHVIVGTKEPTPVGLVAAYQANFQDGHAYLAAERFTGRKPSPLLIFGVALFIDYVFTCWDFHKLYLEVSEYNVRQFQSGIGRLFDVEATLHEHLWYDGRRWDQLILALYRQRWREEGQRLLAAARPSGEQRLLVRIPRLPEGT